MRCFHKLLRFENLEPRQVLSGHSLFAAMPLVDPQLPRLHLPGSIVRNLTEFQPSGVFHNQSSNLRAVLTDFGNNDLGAGIQFHTGFQNGQRVTTLTITARGLYPDDLDLDLTVNGADAIELASDHQGLVSLTYSTNPVGNQLQLPADFPVLKTGDTLGLYTASGQVFRGTTPALHMTAAISDGLSVQGNVNYLFDAKNGSTHSRFVLNVSGLAPDTQYDIVMTDNRTLDTVTTDSAGNIHLVFSTDDGTMPNNFPVALDAGDSIYIGNASGELQPVATHRGYRF